MKKWQTNFQVLEYYIPLEAQFWGEERIQTKAGKILSDLCTLNGIDQIIEEPTHIAREGIETCIDLILTNQPFAFVDKGVIPSPDSLCKHQIIFGKINLVWDYHLANVDLIRHNLGNFDWETNFQNKCPDEMVKMFSEFFLNLMEANIPNKVITVNDEDAPWVTPEVKNILRKNRKVYNEWVKKGRDPLTREKIKCIQLKTNHEINEAKNIYMETLSKKICDPLTGQKTFWSAYKRLSNKKNITNIPPLYENNKYVPNFKEKANIFNIYFANQCRPLDRYCKLATPFFSPQK